MRKTFIAAIAATAMISSAAMAAVNVSEDGVGFVGKGDISMLYGWNNAQAKANATQANLSFFMQEEKDYEGLCTWTTETGGKKSKTIIHHVTMKRSILDTAAVDYSNRNNKTGNLTGFNLNGFAGDETLDFPIPQVGDACIGEGTDATYEAVTVVADTGPLLYVQYLNTTPNPLPNTVL